MSKPEDEHEDATREEPTCATCRFWQREEGRRGPTDNLEGMCRRYPPVILDALIRERVSRYKTHSALESVEAAYSAEFPRTYEFSWCGEHQPK